MPCNHRDACQESKEICDYLLEAIVEKGLSVLRQENNHYCDIWSGRKFAYISHSKRKRHLNIWFLGSPEEAKKFRGLQIKTRNETSGTWNDWGGSFTVSSFEQANEAANLLQTISYPKPN